ncbi:hypothetical protein ASPWEDRAFT_25976 [Aspergillus wentii DTO 134E9]|uniref:Uncharacterized protein n=1 Tax=Aspergillus wentii DTO 134E9 TaxID=1073089 RepID=A0A1L9RNP4_ASPWE|nr:uncharacterized protein ASPWEDRAFT_25976 [Aspergillus wentii DTO 134E9]KAI9934345.1 hypothetical protein MW887_005422 [Aspergillus wentii]OJJ36512.1 hypothetical protein ASPWEDRAFT_25976 [Aspergillus wentii DTO 134E9]
MKAFTALAAFAALCAPAAAFGNSTAPWGNYTVHANSTRPAPSTFSTHPASSSVVPSATPTPECDPSEHHKTGGPPFGPACKTPPGWIKNGRPTAPANGYYDHHPQN